MLLAMIEVQVMILHLKKAVHVQQDAKKIPIRIFT